MYSDMPQLVNAGGFDGWPSSPPPAGANAMRWTGSDSAPVMPGGFGAGTPRPQQQQPFGPNATPASVQRSLSRGISRSPSASNPWLLAPRATGPDPFSVPAAAFDQDFPPGAFGGASPGFVQPWGMDQSPPPLAMASPRTAPWYPTPGTHQQDPEEGEYELPPPPLGGWGGNDPWVPSDAWEGFGQAGGSPSPSVSSGFASGPRSQYTRPEEWRRDFSMSKPGALTRFFSLGKGSKDGTFSFLSRPSVHWTVDAKGAGCSWDIRRPPDGLLVLPDQRPLSYLELQEGAMNPPPLRMKLVHPKLPWTVHVAAGPGEVITVAHLLYTLHTELARQVFQRDFWNDDVSEADRKRIHAAWTARCAGDRAIAEQGVKRVDFLGDRWVFEGIRRVGDAWEMKLKSGRGRM